MEQENQVENQVAENQTDTQAEDTTTEASGQAEEKGQEQQTVPYDRFQEKTAEAEQLKTQNQLLQQQLAIMSANVSTQRQKPTETFDIFKEVGLEGDEDIPNVKQQKQIMEYYGRTIGTQLANLQFKLDRPDFSQLVGKPEDIARGQFAKPLNEALKTNPALITQIQTSSNPQLTAYEIAKAYQTIHQATKPAEKDKNKPINTDKISEAVANANRVKSSSNVKGGGGLSEEGRYVNMSDEEFIKIAEQNGAQLY